MRRRELLRSGIALSAAVAAAPLAACAAPAATSPSSAAAVLPPPETTTIRISSTAPCDPWYWYCEPFLREEGFTEISLGKGTVQAGDADFTTTYGNYHAGAIDAGLPFVALAGLHTGCIMVFARPGITTVADLRGKTILVLGKQLASTSSGAALEKSTPSLDYGFLVSLLAHVGMQPSDVNFVEVGENNSVITPFIDGKADAILTASAQGPLLLANPKNPGKVILDTSLDKPWSQNYCCLLTTTRAWAAANPNAAKRATRAILRAVDEGRKDLRAAAKAAIDKGTYKSQPAVTEQVIYDVIKDESFDWREYDPEETVRFFALRLADAKLIKKTPQQIIAEGTDFAYFRQLRKELRA